jgi:hypothetical protein
MTVLVYPRPQFRCNSIRANLREARTARNTVLPHCTNLSSSLHGPTSMHVDMENESIAFRYYVGQTSEENTRLHRSRMW